MSEVKKPENGVEPDHHRDSFVEFINDFIMESDRACVILGAAKVDAILGQILDKFLLPSPGATDDLLEGDSPLSTFSARIKACHRVGLIDDQLAKSLNTFRRLRNGFAHEVTHSSLAAGSARDRVISMAEPYCKYPAFLRVRGMVAKQLSRPEDDAGVIFRALLALIYVSLIAVIRHLTPVERQAIGQVGGMLRDIGG